MGIAVDEGCIDGVDHLALGFFPDRTVANSDPRKEAMTLEHLLTMTSGLDWRRSRLRDSDSTAQMEQSPDWVQFVLDRPMAEEPRAVFKYNNGGSHLLSAIVQETIEMSTLTFAQTHLFEPIGISDAFWDSDPSGIARGKQRLLAFVGYLLLELSLQEPRGG